MNKLQSKVLEQMGHEELNREALEELRHVAAYGASGGVSGFIYYSDTVEFFDANKALIIQQAEYMAEELGCEVFEMISNFNCLKDSKLDSVNLYKIIYSNEEHEDSTQVKNALAWFALEETAYQLENEEVA